MSISVSLKFSQNLLLPCHHYIIANFIVVQVKIFGVVLDSSFFYIPHPWVRKFCWLDLPSMSEYDYFLPLPLSSPAWDTEVFSSLVFLHFIPMQPPEWSWKKWKIMSLLCSNLPKVSHLIHRKSQNTYKALQGLTWLAPSLLLQPHLLLCSPWLILI